MAEGGGGSYSVQSPPLTMLQGYACTVPPLIMQLVGLALMGIGSWLVHTGHSFSYFTGSHFFSGAAILIICGIAIFIITGCGIAGAIFRIKFILYIVSSRFSSSYVLTKSVCGVQGLVCVLWCDLTLFIVQRSVQVLTGCGGVLLYS